MRLTTPHHAATGYGDERGRFFVRPFGQSGRAAGVADHTSERLAIGTGVDGFRCTRPTTRAARYWPRVALLGRPCSLLTLFELSFTVGAVFFRFGPHTRMSPSDDAWQRLISAL